MKAPITTAYGDVDKLTVADVPEPQIGDGDVKVEVHAARINPIDWKLFSGQARAVMELHFLRSSGATLRATCSRSEAM